MAHRDDFVSVRGVRTHLFEGGRGEPVLVLHPEFAANLWLPYHDQLASQFRVLAPDHPGFGQSERPDKLEDIDDIVFHYVDLLDQLELERVSIVGTSVGGWIAAAFAVRYPRRVERLVLAAPAGIRVEGIERYDLFSHPIEETLRHLFHDERRAAQIVPVRSGPEVIASTYREATTLARLSWNPYLYDPKLQRRLCRVSTPTLIVWGAEDRVLPLEHAKAFHALIPDSTLELLPECGHLVPLEQGDTFSGLAIEFLSR